ERETVSRFQARAEHRVHASRVQAAIGQENDVAGFEHVRVAGVGEERRELRAAIDQRAGRAPSHNCAFTQGNSPSARASVNSLTRAARSASESASQAVAPESCTYAT